MPVAKFEMPDGRIARFEVPEGTTPEQAQAMIQEHIARNPELSKEAQQQPRQRESEQPQEEDSFLKNVADVGLEGMAAVNRGVTQTADFLTTKPVNAALEWAGSDARVPSITGALSAGTQGNFMEDSIGRDIIRTGGEMVGPGVATGAALRAGAQNLPKFTAASEGVRQGTLRQMGASTMGQDAGYSAASGAGAVLGREADEAMGGSGAVGEFAGAVAAPLSILGATNLAQRGGQKSADIAQRLASGSTDRDLAKYMLAPDSPQANRPFYQAVSQNIAAGQGDEGLVTAIRSGAPKAVKDPIAKETIKQGFDEGVVAAIKGTTPANKKKMLEMVRIAKKGKENAVYGASNRPADVAGESLSKRVRFVKKVNREAGEKLDRVARSLKGDTADFQVPKSKFMARLDDMGVNVDPKGNLDFVGSDIEGIPGAEKAMKQIYARMGRAGSDDAYEMHRLKRFIDEQVTYGKSTEGLSGKAERTLKSLRSEIDASLDQTFPVYDQANTQYGESIQALNAFQDSAGTKVNLFGDNADKALGTVSRRLLSNAQSRVNMMDAIKQLDDISLKYGAKYDDDIMTQVLFADELDSVFGAAARTSLQGDVGKGVKRGVEGAAGQRSLTGLGIDAAAAGIEKARGVNEENAFKAIMKLLAREAK